ncbi:MAG TPA: type II toxin-antitoxin system RelE/ParE family toxin [Thermoanaerobaculia bacterium]|nr:type II toxin-antitoxin system RelE/ParE family toxin [Thermoanaerobaculia bacterium]
MSVFKVELTRSALEDLRYLKKLEQRLVLDSIENQLSFEPTTSTRNRKRLRENRLSEWELRVGVFRIFYDVDMEARAVWVKAVGRKEHNQLLIRGEEFSL